MGKAKALAMEIITRNKTSFAKQALYTLKWKYTSFAKKQIMIDESIDAIVDIIRTIDSSPQLARIVHSLLSYNNKTTIPTQKDIEWLSEIITAMQTESNNNILDIENYYILLEFFRSIPHSNNSIEKEMNTLCKKYTKQFPEALLIPSEELRVLLTTTSLYYPEMSSENIVQAVCGVIKLGVRFAELTNNSIHWEESLRKELCQIHSLHLHICLLLEDSELRYFLEESENQEPAEITNTIIQQLTLEEIYRKREGENTLFSKITILFNIIPRTIYYGKYSPIFTLCNYIEYCQEYYSVFFSLPIQYFTEILSLTPQLNKVESFVEFSLMLSKLEDIAILFKSKEQYSPSVSSKQKELLQKYSQMTKEELSEAKKYIEQEGTKGINSYITYSPQSNYQESNIIFNHIENILLNDTTMYACVPQIRKFDRFLEECGIQKTNREAFNIITSIIKEKDIVKEYTLKEHGVFIQKIQNECKDLLNIPLPIFYAILTDTIKKDQTLQDICILLYYCSTVINIAQEERLHVGSAMASKEISNDEALSICNTKTNFMPNMAYEYSTTQIQ